MRSFWSDPYLWIHLAGVAALPIFLEICFLGLAVGDPILPLGLELLLVAAIGIAPVVWMQWQRPFYIFSLVAIALKPEQLTVDQRKLLRLFKSPLNRGLAVGVPVVLFWVLWQLYRYAPIASDITPLSGGARGWGLLLAAIAFLASNLFLQVPVSVASVLLTRETTFAATEPYLVEQIPAHFTVLGWRVKQILPEIVTEEPKPLQPTASSSSSIAESQKPERSSAQFSPSTPVELATSPETTIADSANEDDLAKTEPLVETVTEPKSLLESLAETSLGESPVETPAEPPVEIVAEAVTEPVAEAESLLESLAETSPGEPPTEPVAEAESLLEPLTETSPGEPPVETVTETISAESLAETSKVQTEIHPSEPASEPTLESPPVSECADEES